MKVRTGFVAGVVTVYGADWCGWTRRQLAYLDEQGIDYHYVNCEKESCPGFVGGFPTVRDGRKVMVGFQEL